MLISYKFPVDIRRLWKTFPGGKSELAPTSVKPAGLPAVVLGGGFVVWQWFPQPGTRRKTTLQGEVAAGGILQFAL